jgi:protein TonB
MAPPRKLSGPNPEYTREALQHNVRGTLVLRCIITAAGEVRSCRVLKSLPYMDDAAIQALEGRRYTPTVVDGTPTDVAYDFTVKLETF